MNFVVLWVYIYKSFLCKIWEHGVLWYSKSEQSATKVSLVFPAMQYAQDGLTDICKVLLSIINCTDLISIYSSYIPPIEHKACTSQLHFYAELHTSEVCFAIGLYTAAMFEETLTLR